MSPKQVRLTANEAIRILVSNGFEEIRQTGSHKIFARVHPKSLITIPYHAGKTLHPKIVKQVLMLTE